MDTEDPLALICHELPLVTSRLADLVVSAPDLSVMARQSEWTVREVAVHVAVGARCFAELAELEPGQSAGVDGWAGLSEAMARRVADITESDPAKLGALLQDAIEDFSEAWAERPGTYPVDLAGFPATLHVLAGVLMGEVVVHGYDMAYGLGRPWPIDPGHAGLILGGYAPILPTIVNSERAKGHTAGYAIDFGGGPVLVLRFTDGVLGLEAPGSAPVDVTICAHPVAYLLVAEGRISRYEAIALGLLSAKGDRPELAVGFWDLFLHA